MHVDASNPLTVASRSHRFTVKKDCNTHAFRAVVLLTLVGYLAGGVCTASTSIRVPVDLPPLPPGTKIDMSSPYFKYWPSGRPALFEVRSDLVLAVPPQFQPFWYPRAKLFRGPAPISAIPMDQRAGVAFQFFLPDFTGYTPENYTKEFDPDRVDVIELQPADPKEVQPGAVGEYPPNMLKRALDGLLNIDTAKRMYGLSCYQFSRQAPETHGEWECVGTDRKADNTYVMLDVYLPPYDSWIKFPTMQARYFTPKYGGVRVVWRTNSMHFSHWEDIDSQIWKFVKTWNIALEKPSNVGSR